MTFLSMPRCAASSRSIRFCWTVRGCGQTLQTYLQSGAWASIRASACMTSWAPLDAASPPTVRIMIWSSDTPRASRINRTFRSSRLRGAKPSVSQPTGSTSILSPLMPSLMYVSFTQLEVTSISGRAFSTSWCAANGGGPNSNRPPFRRFTRALLFLQTAGRFHLMFFGTRAITVMTARPNRPARRTYESIQHRYRQEHHGPRFGEGRPASGGSRGLRQPESAGGTRGHLARQPPDRDLEQPAGCEAGPQVHGILGPRHSDTLTAMENLGVAY